MNTKTFNADAVRAALRSAERRLAEILKDLESNDMDDAAVAERLREIGQGLRRFAPAA
jgi:cob(I)alamin adenosyltransferase